MLECSKFWKSVIPLLIGVGVGIAAGYSVWHTGPSDIARLINNSLVPIEESGTSYSFVHPLLGYRLPEATIFGEYVSLKDSFQKIADTAKSDGNATRVSVYFRDLDVGRWVGIDQDATYHPASLLKVPTMIAFYKEAEENPTLFSQSVTYDSSVMPTDPYTAESKLAAGRSYSIDSLIRSMITDSDNGATFTLLNLINPDFLDAVYISLGVKSPNNDSANYQISARTYGLFFRVLYNTTYLSSSYSERALKLLSEATFTNGLVAGLPKGAIVAHKYGYHIFSGNGGVVTGIELSDCGIVYYPAHPYLLCVMIGGYNEPTASKVIADISRAAYVAVEERYATSSPAQ